MKIAKMIAKICAAALLAALGLAVAAVVGLNVAKFALYREYYAAESALCKNPGLNDGFICQGIAAVENADRILVSGYMQDKQPSRIYITTRDSETTYVTLHCDGKPYTGHAGGLAVSGDMAYIANGSKIYAFPLADVLSAPNGGSVNIGQGTKVNNKASFLYTDDAYLYVGSFMQPDMTPVAEHVFDADEGTHTAICSVYPIDDLSAPVRVYSIRDEVQGACFLPDGAVVFSTSYGLSSSVYAIYDLDDARDSGRTLDGAPVYILDRAVREISGPAMAEGMDAYDGRIITLTESASNKYLFGKLFFATDIVALDPQILLAP